MVLKFVTPVGLNRDVERRFIMSVTLFSSFSGVTMMFAISLHFNILYTSSVKQHCSEFVILYRSYKILK